ncbi:unnamed protein product [Fusarium graminearum]|uniref:Chromosome 2, complete genome n=1 Tax=Gibberella zeae (strain ATCC MYA-4620 / CBS 123657 / FGSC 9075 / NRRL 31084 / PH-1) TaxID=229533 RepID=A0A0E0S7J9_GIBZE|nr:hypothetical protein FG05_35371 [Fusarium graminearum]CEF79474.1 unnamed protein product [Fusarium graminearum]CZS82760.1 unnamed protein product [Fusarium graminearum]
MVTYYQDLAWIISLIRVLSRRRRRLDNIPRPPRCNTIPKASFRSYSFSEAKPFRSPKYPARTASETSWQYHIIVLQLISPNFQQAGSAVLVPA